MWASEPLKSSTDLNPKVSGLISPLSIKEVYSELTTGCCFPVTVSQASDCSFWIHSQHSVSVASPFNRRLLVLDLVGQRMPAWFLESAQRACEPWEIEIQIQRLLSSKTNSRSLGTVSAWDRWVSSANRWSSTAILKWVTATPAGCRWVFMPFAYHPVVRRRD